ncbi:MAG TPA: carboxypeptidase-like regulatory domain-containing protein [Vicinamibacterales bacterium]|nr:carboxypeptidase-like regulatory domain-containing protein [Vicinamibacterales bacterium]
MRRLIASSLAALMLTLGVPLIGAANGTAASVFGQVVDAGGRGAAGTTVDLLQNGAVLSSTVTTFDGRFTMNGIAPGTYVVRTLVNGRPAGVQVSLKAGQSAPVVVVLPSMVTAAAQAQFASLLANLATTVAGTTMATVVTELAAQAAADADEGIVTEAAQSGATFVVLLQALQNSNLTPAQITAVANAVVQIAVSLPPETPAETQQAITSFISSSPTITIPQPAGAPPIVITTPAPTFTGSATQ